MLGTLLISGLLSFPGSLSVSGFLFACDPLELRKHSLPILVQVARLQLSISFFEWLAAEDGLLFVLRLALLFRVAGWDRLALGPWLPLVHLGSLPSVGLLIAQGSLYLHGFVKAAGSLVSTGLLYLAGSLRASGFLAHYGALPWVDC